MEDAVTLADCLSAPDLGDGAGVTAALEAYEASRRPATAKVQKAAHRVGRLASLRNPVACVVRNQVVKRSASRSMAQFETEFAQIAAAKRHASAG